jgi:hypothetical protein
MPFLKRLTLDGNKLTTLHGTSKTPAAFSLLFSSIVFSSHWIWPWSRARQYPSIDDN